jgi:hypothetical protein
MKRAWIVNAAASGANLLLNMALGVTVAGGSLIAEYTMASLRVARVQQAVAVAAAATGSKIMKKNAKAE